MENKFKEAGLVVKMFDKPFVTGRGMERIVQIDIQRKLGGNIRSEYFRIYKPENSLLQVRDIDKSRKQLVLLVKENETKFEETIVHHRWEEKDFHKWVKLEFPKMKKSRIVEVSLPGAKGKYGYVVVERTTDPRTRYFLMGVDERQLFIAQCPNPVTTVDEARKSLGKTVQFAEGTRNTSRQGEWFFLETDDEMRDKIEEAIKKNVTKVWKKADVSAPNARIKNSHQHVADELVVLPPTILAHGFGTRTRRIFVRGKIRHGDHRTIKFNHWREVVRNSEAGAEAGSRPTGVFWVD